MATATLTNLPPELLDQVISYIPTAKSVASLGRTSKQLHAVVEKEDAWKSFNPARFPSLCPAQTPSHKDVARTITTLSKAWDRRAFVARYIEPRGHIRAFPGDNRIERWKRPRGQTIGFTPQLDCFEDVGSSWRERREVLAFSAGAGLCVRQKEIGDDGGAEVRWMVYRPVTASEGSDDITTLHLLRTREGGEGESKRPQELIVGTANGDLQLLRLPAGGSEGFPTANFSTQGQPVRSSSLLQQPCASPLLAASIGDDCISLYTVDTTGSPIRPTSSINIVRPGNGHRPGRTWSTKFLSSDHLAIGFGPSDAPIHVYSLTPSGIEKEAMRMYSLEADLHRVDGESPISQPATKSMTSVYPIAPLSPSQTSATNREGRVFLSGALDGVIRLHDLRSDRQVEQKYVDPTDDSAIYSLLPRGRETLIAGSSRHSLLKIFDMRLGAKAYSYLNNDAETPATDLIGKSKMSDWNLFLKPHSATYPGRGGGNNWARRSAESSIYSLASPSPCSPYLYAGVENAVVELAFTSILDPHPDPVYFRQPPDKRDTVQGFQTKEVLDLAMYDQTSEMMKLQTQRSFWETFRARNEGWKLRGAGAVQLDGLDERWTTVSG